MKAFQFLRDAKNIPIGTLMCPQQKPELGTLTGTAEAARAAHCCLERADARDMCDWHKAWCAKLDDPCPSFKREWLVTCVVKGRENRTAVATVNNADAVGQPEGSIRD
jgi:hypothetical protein